MHMGVLFTLSDFYHNVLTHIRQEIHIRPIDNWIIPPHYVFLIRGRMTPVSARKSAQSPDLKDYHCLLTSLLSSQ